MKIKLIYFLVLITLICCCKEEKTEDISLNEHLKYFGFAVTDCGVNKLNEIDSFVNLVDMCLENFDNITARIINNTSGNNVVIVHLQGIFIDNIVDANSPTGIQYELLPDYTSRFELWCSNNIDIPIEKIAAFTIADESVWNRMSMSDLDVIAKMVKTKFPNTPIMVIESSEGLDEFEITTNIDWIGFDKYGILNPNKDNDYINDIQKLKSKITSTNQRIVIVMETQWIPLYTDLGYSQSVLKSMSKSYYDYAKRDNDVIALIAYLLPSDFDMVGQKGFFDLDYDVQNMVKEIGLEIVNK